jgi:hypothetical protein
MCKFLDFSNKKYLTLRGINNIKIILITFVCMLRHPIAREIICNDESKGPQLLRFSLISNVSV